MLSGPGRDPSSSTSTPDAPGLIACEIAATMALRAPRACVTRSTA
jgi:hypothetical protein